MIPQPEELVFYASDLDGDRHLFATVPEEQARRWRVTYVHADGTREAEEKPSVGFAPGRDPGGTPRVCWFADREPGSWYEFVLPDGQAFTAWADGNRDPGPPVKQAPDAGAQENLFPEVDGAQRPEPDEDSELASALGMALEDFAEVFGTGYRKVLRFHDYDADPTGGMGDGGEGALFGPWYVAGEPAQIMMRVTHQHLQIAAPAGVWHGQMLVWDPHDTTAFPVRRWSRPQVREAIARILAYRRDSFTWCRYCHRLTGPEGRYQPDVCSGCATRHMGILY